MSKILNADELMTVLFDVDPQGARLLISRVEFAVTQVAMAVARKLGVQCTAASWEGAEFAGLAASFYPAQPGQACPRTLDQRDPGGDWEDAPAHIILVGEKVLAEPAGLDLVKFLPQGRIDTTGLRREMLGPQESRDSQHALGFVDAVESMMLALSSDGVPADKLNRAVQACLDAYDNNVVQAQVESDQPI